MVYIFHLLMILKGNNKMKIALSIVSYLILSFSSIFVIFRFDIVNGIDTNINNKKQVCGSYFVNIKIIIILLFYFI